MKSTGSTFSLKFRFTLSHRQATIVGTSQTGTPIVVQKIISVSKSPLASTANVIATTSPSVAGTPTSNARRTTTPPGTSLINPHTLAKVQTISTANLSPLQQQTLLQTINKQIRFQQTAASAGQQSNLIIKPQVFATAAGLQARPAIKSNANIIQNAILSSTAGTPTTSTATAIIVSSTATGMPAIPTAMATTVASSPGAVRTTNSLIGKVIADQSGQIISLENLVQSNKIGVPALVTAQSTANPQSYVIPISLSGKSIAGVNRTFQPLMVSQPRLLAQPTVDAVAKPITSFAVMGGLKTSAALSPVTRTNAVAKSEILKIGTAPTTAIIQQASPRTTQLVNAKVIGMPNNQRVKAGANLRMVNASNLNITNLANMNIANIDGKQVIIASKIQSPAHQLNVSQQQSGATATTTTSRPLIWRQQANAGMGPQAVVIGNQIVKLNTSAGNQIVKLNTSSAGSTASHVVLTSTGQPIKIHTPNIITTSPTTARANVSLDVFFIGLCVSTALTLSRSSNEC